MEKYKKNFICNKCLHEGATDKWYLKYPIVGPYHRQELIERICRNCGYTTLQEPACKRNNTEINVG